MNKLYSVHSASIAPETKPAKMGGETVQVTRDRLIVELVPVNGEGGTITLREAVTAEALDMFGHGQHVAVTFAKGE